jgi:uncharacterized protein YdhG (YjbR/CyaY superfamily)
MKSKPDSIDEYLAAVSSPKRAALQSLRRTIRSAAPQAEECISYGLPAFRQGRMLVAFGAKENHCALYLMSDKTLAGFRSALEGFETSKGTVRFQDDRPLPATLVRRLVKARLAENAALDAASQRKPKPSAHRASGTSSRRAEKRLSAARKPARRKR